MSDVYKCPTCNDIRVYLTDSYAKQERAAIVAWLRRCAQLYAEIHDVPVVETDALIRARQSRERTDEVLADHSLDFPLSEEDYRRASFDARRSGGSEAVAQLARGQRAAKARAAAARAADLYATLIERGEHLDGLREGGGATRPSLGNRPPQPGSGT